MLLELLRTAGAGLSALTQRWVPDSWVICMMLTLVALLLATLGAGSGVEEAVLAWGQGLWKLLTLAMQFTIIMVASYACVSSRPVYGAMNRLASLPDPQRPVQAVLLTGLLSLGAGYLNWALSLMAGAMFVPFLLKHNPRADVRVVIAAAYLGLGTVWHGGLSGSAPLIMATPDNPLFDPTTGAAVVERLYPTTETLFNAFNIGFLLAVGAIIVLSFFASLAIQAISDWTEQFLAGETFWMVVVAVTSFAINVAAFTLLYKYLPKTRIALMAALQGGLLTAVTWAIGRRVLAIVISNSRYSAYGVIGSFLAIMLWFFYASAITFLGAEYVKVVDRNRTTRSTAKLSGKKD